MRRSRLLALTLLPVLALSGCGGADDEDAAAPPSAETKPLGSSTTGTLAGPAGEEVGTVTISFDRGDTVVDVQVSGLAQGVHGFHLHKTGLCEPKSPDPTDPAKTGDFLSAGGHLAAEGQSHGDHDGDLPPLLVGADGRASATFTSDRLTQAAVLDDDGTAVMVHADPDNFAAVPERYAPQGPDETTRKTGDAGARIACAPLTAQGADAG